MSKFYLITQLKMVTIHLVTGARPPQLRERTVSAASGMETVIPPRLTRSRPVQRPRRNDPEENSSSLEHLDQGILTLQTLISTLGSSGIRSPQFSIGQWVDAKDTVNQWLESTIIDMSETQVLIHYNG